MKTGFDRFTELLLIYELLKDEERYEEAHELSKKIAQIFLRVHISIPFLFEEEYRAYFHFDKFQRYESDKMISNIITNENYSTEYDESCVYCERHYKQWLKFLEETFGKKLITEYVTHRCWNDSIQLDAIITDMLIANNIAGYSKAELKSIKDDWKGFFKKHIDQGSDRKSLYHARHRIKFMSDVLNYMDAKIDYDNDLFNVEKAE